MKLLAVRDLNTNDPLPGLGEKKVPVALPVRPPQEQRSSTNPNVIIKPDGKMETAIPGNKKAVFQPGLQDMKIRARKVAHREI